MLQGLPLILNYFPDLTTHQQEQIQAIASSYIDWNTKINVISRKDIENLWTHHLLHSLSIAKFYSFQPGQKVLDVGTGGGFPGVPLAILFPETDFVLVDSIQKKIRVVQEVSASAKINNIQAQAIRAEQVKGMFDMVISRAVTTLDPFISWVETKIHWQKPQSGILYLKGGDLSEELLMTDPRRYKYHIHGLAEVFREPFFETKKLLHIFRPL